MQAQMTVIAALLLASLALLPAAFCAAAPDDAIPRHRMGTITVRAQPGATVRVIQQAHEFWFGTAISSGIFRDDRDPEVRAKYLSVLKENFNSAVHENALKWYAVGKNPDRTSYATADRILEWCDANGIPMRGHCIFWAKERYTPNWVKELDDEALRETVRRHAREVTARYRGRIGEYDVINEMIAGHFFARRLGPGIRADMFRWAQEGDPDATLYVNDYSILSGGHLDAYEKQIAGLLEAGAPVGGIGCQGHFGGGINMGQVKRSLDRLARFDLPIRITEFDINTDDEPRKARLLKAFYRTCFAHPAVTGILMWGFWEGAHWRPKAALWKRDWTPTPAARAYRELVFHEWWTDREGQADSEGRCEVEAFYGRHLVESGGKSREVFLRKTDGKAEVDLRDEG